MNRMRMTLLGLILALGLASLPLAHSALAARSGGTKTTAGTLHAARAGKSVVAYVASVLGVTPAVLQADLKAGQTLLQIGSGKFSSADALATALLAPVKAKLDAATTDKKLSATGAGAMYAKAHAAVATLVVTPHPALGTILAGAHGVRAHGAGAASGLLSTLTIACNTNAATLKAAVAVGGKSLLQICQTTNPSATASGLVSALLNAMKSRLDKAVTAKKITTAQESATLTQVQAYLTTLVTTPIPAGGLHLHG